MSTKYPTPKLTKNSRLLNLFGNSSLVLFELLPLLPIPDIVRLSRTSKFFLKNETLDKYQRVIPETTIDDEETLECFIRSFNYFSWYTKIIIENIGSLVTGQDLKIPRDYDDSEQFFFRADSISIIGFATSSQLSVIKERICDLGEDLDKDSKQDSKRGCEVSIFCDSCKKTNKVSKPCTCYCICCGEKTYKGWGTPNTCKECDGHICDNCAFKSERVHKDEVDECSSLSAADDDGIDIQYFWYEYKHCWAHDSVSLE
jgi:hypothetical protein